MKKCFFLMLLCLLVCLWGCQSPADGGPRVAASTRPVALFTELLLDGSGIGVDPVITEAVSCLHDHTLTVEQMKTLERADAVILSGAGLEDFLSDALVRAAHKIDASENIHIHCAEAHADHHDHGHFHDTDPHIWLSPENAQHMAENICAGLTLRYPTHAAQFSSNLQDLLQQLEDLQTYGNATLAELSCRELITFHDGFHYLAEAFDLHILHAVEEESGSESSAAELKELIGLVQENRLPAVFTEVNGSVSAADVIAAQTGIAVYNLDMAMSGDSYFDAMYHNIDTLKEALG